MSRPSNKPWTREQLGWYRQFSGFDTTHWFDLDERVSPESNSVLWEFSNGRKELRREPYFWEIFRRHPQLGEILSACSSHELQTIFGWVKALLLPGSAGALEFLLKFAGQTWIKLGENCQQIFTDFVDVFAADGMGHCKGSLPAKNPLVDLDSFLDVPVGDESGLLSSPEVTLRELLEPYAVAVGGDLRVFAIRRGCLPSQIISGAESLFKDAGRLQSLGEKLDKKEGVHSVRLLPQRVSPPPEALLELLRRANPKATLRVEWNESHLWGVWQYKPISAPKVIQMRLNSSRLLTMKNLDTGMDLSNKDFVNANEVFTDMNLLRIFRDDESALLPEPLAKS